MLTFTIELWNANDNLRRKTLHQIVVHNIGRGKATDQSHVYQALLYQPEVKVPTRGEDRGKLPKHHQVLGEVTLRHVQADGDLELMFRVMRELRQEYPELFERPNKAEEEPFRAKAIRRVI